MTATLFFTTFLFIFLAAAPGRTTFVLILLASQARLTSIFMGAAAAFFVQSLISILLGRVLALFPQFITYLAAGFLFLYFAYSFWRQSQKSQDRAIPHVAFNARSVFLLVFMAEFGDVSQLAIATAAARSPSKLVVFFAAVTSLWLITGGALFLGHHLGRALRPQLIQKVASVGFAGAGLFLAFLGFSALI
jgi:Ca2+/H+ antiporter, TMEM165/GDT1 family